MRVPGAEQLELEKYTALGSTVDDILQHIILTCVRKISITYKKLSGSFPNYIPGKYVRDVGIWRR